MTCHQAPRSSLHRALVCSPVSGAAGKMQAALLCKPFAATANKAARAQAPRRVLVLAQATKPAAAK